MIPKSGNRFSDQIMPFQEEGDGSGPTELARTCGMIPKSGNRFSDQIMPFQEERDGSGPTELASDDRAQP
jgi:hypothetical protein